MPPNGENVQNPAGDFAEARQQIIDRAEQINAEQDEAEKIQQRNELRDQLVQELEGRALAAEEVNQVGLTDRRDEAKEIRLTITKVLEAINQGIIEPPEHARELFTDLSQRSLTLTDQATASLYETIRKYLTEDISFAPEGESPSPFEQDFQSLMLRDPIAARVLQEVILADPEKFGLTVEQAQAKLILERAEILGRSAYEQEESLREMARVLEKYPEPEDRVLINALFKPAEFERYAQLLHDELEVTDLTGEALSIALSETLRERIQMVVGKLYQSVDESNPAEFWEEAERRGSFYYSIEVLGEALRRQIQNLRYRKFSDTSVLSQLEYFRRKPKEMELKVPTTSKYEDAEGGGVDSWEVRHFVLPQYTHEKVSFSEYVLSVYNAVEDEIRSRKVFHNARALPYHRPGEEGYYGRLAGYFEDFMPASSIDLLYTLPDSDKILLASRLWEKLYQADFAKYNWIHQPAEGQLIPDLKLTKTDVETLTYLKAMNPDAEDWMLKRALIMAIGDNYSVSMRAIEVGAYADAPMSIEKGGEASFASYDKRDNIMYRVFNQQAHEGIRWSQEATLLGNLIFLPLEGSKVGKGAYDHRILLEEMMKSMNAFVAGKPAGDVERFVDQINIGNVGSIYTRGSWRDFLSYEGWLMEESGRLGVLDTWKTLENVGVEVLKDFVANVGEKAGPFSHYGKFYEEVQESDRRALVEHIYRRYFNPAADAAEMQTKIDVLEGARDKKSAYKSFFYETFARAYKQRVPTLFIRLERNKFVSSDRERAWKLLQGASGLPSDKFDLAIKDLCAVEALLREDVSSRIFERLGTGDKLRDINVDYNLTEAKVRDYLESRMGLVGQRLENAVNIFNRANAFLDDLYLKEFGDFYNEKGFPFAIGVEELERRLLAHRAAGERTPARAIGDIGSVEKNVADVIRDYLDVLQKTSISRERSFEKLIESIEKAKKTIESIHGLGRAYALAEKLVMLTVYYFRKDDKAIFFPTNLFRANKKNSLAAEFVPGPFRGLWQWEVSDVNRYLFEVERAHLLTRDGYEVQKAPEYEEVPKSIKLFGKEISLGKMKIRKPGELPSTKKIREKVRADQKYIILEALGKYLPLGIFFLLFFFIQQAVSDLGGEKKT